MKSTFNYYLLRNYGMSVFMVLIGLGFLWPFNQPSLNVYIVICIASALIFGCLLWLKSKIINKRVFNQLDSMTGRPILIVFLLAQFFAIFIDVKFNAKLASVSLTIPLAIIICGFCFGFGSYLQVRTLKSTGLYDDKADINSKTKVTL